jgi:hypothetical protein
MAARPPLAPAPAAPKKEEAKPDAPKASDAKADPLDALEEEMAKLLGRPSDQNQS